jgi:hypothetical protein
MKIKLTTFAIFSEKEKERNEDGIQFEDATKNEVEKLISESYHGECNLFDMNHNESPSVGDFLVFAEKHSDILFHGSICKDFVNIDSFTAEIHNEDELMPYLKLMKSADVFGIERGEDCECHARAWWD